MNLVSDIITYIRRIIKTPSNASISDNLLIDYINRFWLMDVDARMQLFDLKTTYQFQTQPGVDRYNMPLYDLQIQPGTQRIISFPVYQGFLAPCYINGIEVPLSTQQQSFFNNWPNWTQPLQQVAIGNGSTGPYPIQIPLLGTNPNPPNPPINGILRGHIDIAGIIAQNPFFNVDPPVTNTFIDTIPTTSVNSAVFFTTIDSAGQNQIVCDSGQFLDTNINCGLLMKPGKAPLGNVGYSAYSETANTINYFTGAAVVNFPFMVPDGAIISAQVGFFQSGLPRQILFYNNTLTLRSPPDRAYNVQLTAYLTPAAFLSSDASVPFAYMSEYIARGAARKILSDTGDIEQFQFYEPLFREQELLVWKRSQRQFTATRTQTIYSQGANPGQIGSNGFGATNF